MAAKSNAKAKAETNGSVPPAKGWNSDPKRAEKSAAHLAAMEASEAKGTPKMIVLPTLDKRPLTLGLIGDAPLIVHKWSQKAIKQMLDKQMGNPTEGKLPKDPEQDYQDSLYHFPGGGYGFPSIAFKNAAVTACTSLGKSITKVAARQAFHIIGDMVKIKGEPSPREDMVRLDSGTADIRYRAEFRTWSIQIRIMYNARVLTDAQITNLFNVAGFAVGVGEWRPEKDGSFGLFHVATKGEKL